MTTEQRTILPPDADRPQFYAHGLFKPSPTQPRKTFLAERIQELSDSIVAKGQLQPILARPNPEYTGSNGMPPYEIVFGESRWRAVRLNDAIPGVLATIRELTDFEVIELQIIENMARTDLHPYEEAEGLKKLLRTADGLQGYANADELAARLGKSRRWVYKRLSLLNLCDKARDALLAGQINASVAMELAVVADPDQQAEALEKAITGWGGEPLSARATAALVHKEFMLNLAKARFDIQAPFQVAGPCTQCPKRSGANPDLFAENTSGDMCQDSKCFGAKNDEAIELKLQAAEAAGHQVMRGAEAARLMPNFRVAPAGYFMLAEPCPKLTDSKQPLSEIFGAKVRGAITMHHPYDDAIITIVAEPDVRKLLKAKKLLREEKSQPKVEPVGAWPFPGDPPIPDRENRAPAPTQNAQARQQTPLSPARFEQLVEERAKEVLGLNIGILLRDALRNLPTLPASIAKLLVMRAMEDMELGAQLLIYKLQGWEFDPTKPSYGFTWFSDLDARLDALIEAGNTGTLGEILVHAMLADELTNPWALDDLSDSDDFLQPSWSLATILGVAEQIEPLKARAFDEAKAHVQAAEDERLGAAKPKDATAAFVEAHAPASDAASGKKSPVKYRDKATGMTWSGRGLQPKWLKAAISDGAKLQDFEVTA